MRVHIVAMPAVRLLSQRINSAAVAAGFSKPYQSFPGNLSLDRALRLFPLPANTQEVFRGCPKVRDGYMFAPERPGLGIDLDEKLAAKFPFPDGPPNFDYSWGTTRRRDGTVIRP